jgi:hypothetical protein
MLALLVQTLFALQDATKGNGSYSSHPSGLRLPSPPFVIRKAQGRSTFLFASPKLQSEEDPGETLDWLQARIGFSDKKLAKLVTLQPTILNLSVRERVEPNISWLQDRLALDQEGLQTVLLRLTPMVGGLAQLLGSNLEENLEPTLVWLQERLLLDDAGVAKLVKKEASFLGFSLETLEERMAWLQTRLVLDDKCLSKLVQRFPPVLGCSVDDNLEPKLAWLQDRLSLDDTSLSKLVQAKPQVLGYSLEENLEPKLKWLQDRFGLDNKSLQKLVLTTPPVFGYSIEDNLEPKLAWLEERLSLNDKSLCFLIQSQPSLLGLDIDNNLEPTIKFYEDCVGSNAAIQLIAKDPRILTSSLKNRLKPRLLECQEAGIPVDTGTIQRIAKRTELGWSNSMISQKNKLLKKELLQGR